jgi:hypothetical protein
LIQHGVQLGVGDAAEAVKGIDFGVAARCVDDGAVSGLVEAGVAVGDVFHWVAGFHDAGAEEIVVATSIGYQMSADAVSSCGFAPDCEYRKPHEASQYPIETPMIGFPIPQNSER